MSFTVIGIGEVLWDVFPSRRRMGGAPVNFACHCRQLGARGVPVSCVGADEDGAAIRRAVAELGLEDTHLQVDPTAPTGTVEVLLDAQGKPVYRIREGVAWDFIFMNEALKQLAPAVDAVCFGTLAQRWPASRDTIRRFVALCPERALKIFDVNLRQAFFSKELIEASLRLATVLKVSDEELPVLASLFGLGGGVLEQIRQLVARFDLRLVAYTRGAEGSMLVTADTGVDHPGCKPAAIDTVGAGDSYTATLCMGLLLGRTLEEIIEHASQVAAFVCEQPGATPVLPERLANYYPAGCAASAG